jgi:hypothetical protein
VSHATLELRDPGTDRERVVVLHADDEIWISPDLWEQMLYAEDGHATFDGVVLSFGTVGEGLGRLTYELIHQPDDRADPGHPGHFAVLRRRS